MAEVRRLRGRVVALFLVVVIGAAVATAIGFWWRGREPSGPIRTLVAASDDSAILLREGYRQHDFVHLTHRGVDGEQRWSVPFHDVPRTARPVVSGSRVACWVRNHLGQLELHAFDLPTGRFLYRAAAVDVPAGMQPAVDLIAVGNVFVASSSTGVGRVHVVDAATGRVVASHELGQGSLAPKLTLVGPVVDVATGDGVDRRVDPRTGAVYVLPAGFSTARDLPASALVIDGLGCSPGLRRCLEASLDGRPLPVVAADRRGTRLFAAAGASFAAFDDATGRLIGSDGPARFTVLDAPPFPTPPLRFAGPTPTRRAPDGGRSASPTDGGLARPGGRLPGPPRPTPAPR